MAFLVGVTRRTHRRQVAQCRPA